MAQAVRELHDPTVHMMILSVVHGKAGRFRKYLHDARTFPRDAADAWRREGRPAVMSELKERTLYRLFRRDTLLVTEQEIASARLAASPPGVEIRRFAGPEWSVLSPLASLRLREKFARAAGRGRTCFVAWRGLRAVGYAWVSERMDSDLEAYPLELPPGTALLWTMYVAPAERNRGVGAALLSARIEHLRERGFRRTWRTVRPRNLASLRAHEKLGGTRTVGRLTYWKLLGRMHARFTPGREAGEA